MKKIMNEISENILIIAVLLTFIGCIIKIQQVENVCREQEETIEQLQEDNEILETNNKYIYKLILKLDQEERLLKGGE